jgi:hypothetical protein
MLEQAIIDAEQLKEAARRTAEEAVIERYQTEIKEAVDKILEQEEPVAETDEVQAVETSLVDELPPVQLAEEDEVVEINLDKLEELMAQEIEDGVISEDDMVNRNEIVEELAEGDTETEVDLELDESLEDLMREDEEVELTEENIAKAIAEMLGEDMISDSSKEEEAEAEEEASESLEEIEELEEEAKPDFPDVDNDGDTDEPIKKAAKEKKAGKRDVRDTMGGGHGDFKIAKEKPDFPFKEHRELQKNNKSLLREQKKISNKARLLEQKVDKYGTVIKQLKDKLNETNLVNAKLLYQNRILNSISLNERQKDKIAEAIENATTVEEAKIIFETLQSAVGLKSKRTRKHESLNEVVTRSSSAFIPHKEVKPSTDAFSERMKRLAGLK